MILRRQPLAPVLQSQFSGGEAVGMGLLQRAQKLLLLPTLEFIPHSFCNEATVALKPINPRYQFLSGIGRTVYGTALITIQTLRLGVGMDLLVRQGTGERHTTRYALRSSHGDAIGAEAIASDRPTKCPVRALGRAEPEPETPERASFGTLAPDRACWELSPGPGETIHQRAFTKGNAA